MQYDSENSPLAIASAFIATNLRSDGPGARPSSVDESGFAIDVSAGPQTRMQRLKSSLLIPEKRPDAWLCVATYLIAFFSILTYAFCGCMQWVTSAQVVKLEGYNDSFDSFPVFSVVACPGYPWQDISQHNPDYYNTNVTRTTPCRVKGLDPEKDDPFVNITPEVNFQQVKARKASNVHLAGGMGIFQYLNRQWMWLNILDKMREDLALTEDIRVEEYGQKGVSPDRAVIMKAGWRLAQVRACVDDVQWACPAYTIWPDPAGKQLFPAELTKTELIKQYSSNIARHIDILPKYGIVLYFHVNGPGRADWINKTLAGERLNCVKQEILPIARAKSEWLGIDVQFGYYEQICKFNFNEYLVYFQDASLSDDEPVADIDKMDLIRIKQNTNAVVSLKAERRQKPLARSFFAKASYYYKVYVDRYEVQPATWLSGSTSANVRINSDMISWSMPQFFRAWAFSLNDVLVAVGSVASILTHASMFLFPVIVVAAASQLPAGSQQPQSRKICFRRSVPV